MTGQRHAVVVGAGIGGLAAAIGLSRAGWHVTVLERSQRLGEVGAGLSLWSNALAALEVLQVAEDIRAQGTMTGGGGLRTRRGRWLLRMPALQEGEPWVSLLMVHRAELHRELLRALPAGAVRTGMTVTGVDSGTTDRPARVEHADADGTRGETEAEVVVAADGLHSRIRQTLQPDARGPRYAGCTAWRGVTAEQMWLQDVSQSWGRGESVGLTQLVDGRVYWFATAVLPEGSRCDDERAEALRRFGDWHDPIRRVIEATRPEDVLRHDLYALPLPLAPFATGRVAVLGDAAHAMTPHLGQGACLALEDAVELAAALCPGDVDVESALRRYDASRRPRAQRLSRQSDQAGRPLDASLPPVTALRDALARVLPRRLALASMIGPTRWTPPTIHARAAADGPRVAQVAAGEPDDVAPELG